METTLLSLASPVVRGTRDAESILPYHHTLSLHRSTSGPSGTRGTHRIMACQNSRRPEASNYPTLQPRPRPSLVAVRHHHHDGEASLYLWVILTDAASIQVRIAWHFLSSRGRSRHFSPNRSSPFGGLSKSGLLPLPWLRETR